jgi:6-aminohexanoate-oligomer endohydrolase
MNSGSAAASAPRLTPPLVRGPRLRNDDVTLTPQPSPGQATLDFDFPGVEVGTAEYSEGPTGVTVIHVPAGARMAIDERGGAVGLISGDRHFTHAIALAGGSLYGLAAVGGVYDELLARRSGCVDWGELALVSGAIIFDFSARDTAISPDAALGRAALRWAVPGHCPIGRCGAGRTASVGKADDSRCEFAGQGAAFRQVGEVVTLATAVVNAVGVVVDRSGGVVRGNYDRATGKRRPLTEDYQAAFAAGATAPGRPGNTTLSVVVTNVRLGDRELEQFGRQVHSSMHRAIQPFHTILDGDVLFALTTDEIELPSAPSRLGSHALNSAALGAIAAEVMWDAVLSAVQ